MTSKTLERLEKIKHFQMQGMFPVTWIGKWDRCHGCGQRLNGIIFPQLTNERQTVRRLCEACYPEWEKIRQPYLVAREMMK